MSYDVYLEGEPESVPCVCAECGHQHKREEQPLYFYRGHTSNTSGMWRGAGLDLREFDGEPASALAHPLAAAIEKIAAESEKYRPMEPANKWGTYESTLAFLRAILAACQDAPDATVRVSA